MHERHLGEVTINGGGINDVERKCEHVPVAARSNAGHRDRHVVEACHIVNGPIVLHDDALANDLAGVVAHVNLMALVVDVATRSGEVGKVEHRDDVVIAFEIPSVVREVHRGELGDGPHVLEGLAHCRLGWFAYAFGPAVRHHLAKHLSPPRDANGT